MKRSAGLKAPHVLTYPMPPQPTSITGPKKAPLRGPGDGETAGAGSIYPTRLVERENKSNPRNAGPERPGVFKLGRGRR